MKSTASSMAVRKPFRFRLSPTVFVEIITFLIIVLFMYAAVSKLLDYENFKYQLGKSPFITNISGITAWTIPAGEIIVALLLVSKRTRLFGSYASLFLMTMFAAYIYAMLNYSYYLPCSCGGVLSEMNWSEHLWFNIGFVMLSIMNILLLTTKNNSAKT